MRRIHSLLRTIFQKGRKSFRIFHFLLLILLILLIASGRYLWKGRSVQKELKPQIHMTSPTPDKTIEVINNKEAEEEDEEDQEDEENNANTKSPWTLLNTSLPSHYYEPSFKSNAPAVVVILTGLGLNKAWTDRVLTTFRGKITLVFSPYSQNLSNQLHHATSLGYQTLIALPMEPYTYPNPDPGPYTVLTGVNTHENIRKIKTLLEKTPKDTNVIGEYGTRFMISENDLIPVLNEIKTQGRLFIDPKTTLHSQVPKICKTLDMTCFQVDITLPLHASFIEREEFLKKIIQNAKENGIIVISVPAIPAYVDHLPEWISGLENNGINLTTIADLQTQKLSSDTSRDQGTRNGNKPNTH